MKNKYRFKSKVWLYTGPAAWHFVTVGEKLSLEIDRTHGMKKRGWGSLRVSAKVGKTEWRTSIFPDKKSGSYLLALKSEVRKKENIKIDDTVSVEIEIL